MPRLSLLAVLMCVACSAPHPAPYVGEQQQRYADYLEQEAEQYMAIGSEMYKAEYCKGFEQRAFHYLDSLRLLRSWTGKLIYQERRETQYASEATFGIECTDGKMTMHCRHMVATTEAGRDAIMCALDTLGEGSVVMFDAVVMTRNNGTLQYHGASLGDEHNILNPQYRIYIVDLREAQSEAPHLYSNLYRAQQAALAVVEPEEKYYRGLISEQGRDAKLLEAEETLEECEKPLSDTERDYIQRLIRALTYRYRYGD